ncbi:MAG TPA: Gfo/Idh/MocA family oxidoreductase [Caulobacteraceae bacterium]|jgi:predicted dehydrogenase
MRKPLRAGVAGAGVFGGHHARKYASLPDVELCGVYDRGTGRAVALAQELGAPSFHDLEAFLDGLDVVTIAAPGVTHMELAWAALDAGVHVYVEKPLASTVQGARALTAKAAEAGVVLACGHQERAVFDAMGLFTAPERPLRVEAVRRGTWSGRNADVSVVLDLMIHDLDLALSLAEGDPVQVDGGSEVSHGPFPDRASAEIAFAGGTIASIEADRDAGERHRTMRLVYPSGTLEIDFLARTFSNGAGFPLNADFAETEQGRDPLGASVAAFVAAVRGEAPRPLVTGEEAARALKLALQVEHAAPPP